MSKKKRRRLIPKTKGGRVFAVLVVLAVAAVVAYFVYGHVKNDDTEQITYSTGTVEKMTLTSSVDATGSVEWVSSEDVTASTSGTVSSLQAGLYAWVDEDQKLFRIDSTWVTAPIAGYIVALDVADGDEVSGSSSSSSMSSSDTSSSTSSAEVLATIIDLDAVRISLTVSESDISSLIVGQKAVITFDALPDLELTGKVTSVDFTATSSSGVVSYAVVVTPDTTNSNLRAGMTASVSIITDVATDVLAVPVAAVKTATDGTSYVQIMNDDGTLTDVTVETGMTTDSYAEILSGLTEGQEIVVSSTKSTSTSETTTNTRDTGGLLDSGGMQGSGMPSGGMNSGGFAPPGQ